MLPRPGRDGGARPKLHLIAMIWAAVGLLALVVSVVTTTVAVAVFGGLALAAAGGAYAVQNARERSAAETEHTLAGGPGMSPGDRSSSPPPPMSMGRLLGTDDPGVGGGGTGAPSTRADTDGLAEALDPFSDRSGPAPVEDPVDPVPPDPTPAEAAGPDRDDAVADEGPGDDGTGDDGTGDDGTDDDGTDDGAGGEAPDGGTAHGGASSGPDGGPDRATGSRATDRDGGGGTGGNG